MHQRKRSGGWLKVADNYRKQLDRLEPMNKPLAEQAEEAEPAPSRSRHAA
jgi:hypothetical protein